MLGLATMTQLEPFHRSTNVVPGPAANESPTATQYDGPAHDTPLR